MRLLLLTISWTFLYDSIDGGFLVDVWLLRGVCPLRLPQIPSRLAGGKKEYKGFSEVGEIHRKTVRVFPPTKEFPHKWYDPYIYDTNVDKLVCQTIISSMGCERGNDDKIYEVFAIPSGIYVGENQREQPYHLDGIKSQMICFEDDLQPIGIPYIIAKGPIIRGIGPTYFIVDPHSLKVIDFFVYKSKNNKKFKLSSFENIYHLYLINGPQMNLINRLLYERGLKAKWTVPPSHITDEPDLYRILTGTQDINAPANQDPPREDELYPSLSREHGFQPWGEPSGNPDEVTWAVRNKKSRRPPIYPGTSGYSSRNYTEPSGTYGSESVHTPERSKGSRRSHSPSKGHSPSRKRSPSMESHSREKSHSREQYSAQPSGSEMSHGKPRSSGRNQSGSDSDGSIRSKYSHEVRATSDTSATHSINSSPSRSSRHISPASLNSRGTSKENEEPSGRNSDRKKSASEEKSRESEGSPTRKQRESPSRSMSRNPKGYLHEQSSEYIAPDESETVQVIQLRKPPRNVVPAAAKSRKPLGPHNYH